MVLDKIPCIKCGTMINEDIKFCPECGTNQTEKLKCKDCGAEIQSGTKFCPECGIKQD